MVELLNNELTIGRSGLRLYCGNTGNEESGRTINEENPKENEHKKQRKRNRPVIHQGIK